MSLKNIILAFLITTAVSPSWGLNRINSISELRPEDSKRTYFFMLKDKKFGQLETIYKGKSKFEGNKGHRFDENLSLDLTPLGNQYLLKIQNRHFVDDSGRYLGDKMDLEVNGQSQEMFMKYKDGIISGYLDRDGNKQEASISVGGAIFSADNNMIDQYESFLANREISVGDTIIDSIFIPQLMIKAPIRIVIEGFNRVGYGNNMFDSAFICHLYEPSDQIIYFTLNRKIIKLLQPSQNVSVLLQENFLDKYRLPAKTVTFMDLIKRIPVFLLFLIMGILLVSPFIRRNFRKPEIYLAAIAGGLLYFLAVSINTPVQKWFTDKFIIPGIQSGGTLYAYAIFSTFFTGLIMETLKLLPIFLISARSAKISSSLIIFGIFCGAGFGICEACALTGAGYQSGAVGMLSWNIFERFFAIIFHLTSGAVFGYGLSRGLKGGLIAWEAMVIIHSITGYLMIFVQKRIIDIAIYELTVALINLVLMLIVYLIIRQSRLKSHSRA